MKKQLVLFLCASTICGAASGGILEKKQKNPGRVTDVPAECPEGMRPTPGGGPAVTCMAINTKGTGVAGRGSHDVHELEKISFTVTGEGLGAPPGTTYLKILTDKNMDGGMEAVLRLVCAGGELRNAALWTVTGTDASGKRTHHPVTFVKEWGAAHPQFRSLSASYLKRKLNRAAHSSGGWQQVEVVSASSLCPSARSAPSPR